MSFFEQIPIVSEIPLELRVGFVRFVMAVVVLLVFWLLRHAVAGFLVKPLRNHVQKTDAETDNVILNAVDGAVSYLVVGLGVYIGILILGLSGGVRVFFSNIALTILLFGVFRLIYGLAVDVVKSKERIKKFTGLTIEKSLLPVLRISVQALVFVIAVFAVAQVWGISLGGLIAGIGLGGLALSLAAKEVLDDVVGFATIISDDLFDVDEYIITPHAEGIVEEIGLRSTKVRQLDQALVIAPNGKLANDSVTNWSRLQKRWFNFVIGLTYDTTVAQIEDLVGRIRSMLEGRESVESDSIVVLFTEYDDSSLNVMVRCYVTIADWTQAHAERHAVNLEIMNIVHEMGLSMAFPSRSLYIETLPDVRTVSPKARDGRENGSQQRQTEQVAAGSTFSKGGPDEEIQQVGENDGDDGGDE